MPPGRGARGQDAAGPKVAIRTPTALALAKEAQEMEAKLEELRKAMERERGMRERSSEGPRWRNGASGLLRGQFRNKQQGAATSSSHSNPASANPSGPSRLNSKTSAPSPSSSATAGVKDGSPPGGELGVSGTSKPGTSRLSSSAGGLGGDAHVVPAPGGLRVSQSRKLAARAASPAAPDVLQVHSQQDLGHSSDRGKQGTAESQAGDDPDLREGAFDEAESHKSFMEALNEWRAGNRAQQAGDGQQQQQPQQQQQQQSNAAQAQPQRSFGLKQLKQQAGIQAQDQSSTGTRSDVQTEPPPPPSQRPSSARHLTYFDRLLLSSASRQAGQAASGSGRDGASPSPRPTPLVPPSQSSRPSSSLSSLRSPLTAQPSSQPLNPPPNQQPPSQPSNQQQGPGTPSVSHPHLSPSATADMHHRHPSSSSFSSEVYSVDCALNPSLASGAGSPSKHHRHKGLDILEELERLEAQQLKACQRYDSDEDIANGQGKGQEEDTIVVTTQVGMLGLTKGVRLPDAIWLPQEEAEQQQQHQQHQQQ